MWAHVPPIRLRLAIGGLHGAVRMFRTIPTTGLRQSVNNVRWVRLGLTGIWFSCFFCHEDSDNRASLNSTPGCIIRAGSSYVRLAAGFTGRAHDDQPYDKGSRDISLETTRRLLCGNMLNQAMDNLATRLAEVSGRHLVVESQLNLFYLIIE